MIDKFVFVVAALLIVSKFADCYSTSRRIGGVANERNPIARFLMVRIGINVAVWLIFLLSVAMVLLAVALVSLVYGLFVPKFLFVLVGSVITLIQFVVAYANFAGRSNPVTQMLSGLFSGAIDQEERKKWQI